MKRTPKFAHKLWVWFVLFAAALLGALWLLQTVFLQGFYDHMVIQNVEKAADAVCAAPAEDLTVLLDDLAYENSFLIFLTDQEGTLLYGTDEHSGVYDQRTYAAPAGDGGNPYHAADGTLSWQVGAGRYMGLPQNYDAFLSALAEGNGAVGYRTADGASYVCGRYLPNGTVLYLSATLEAVGGTVNILRVQLLWVTAAALALSLILAWFLSRRFAGPVSALSAQAEHMAAGDFSGEFEKGFCAELDGLADTLGNTAAALEKSENVRREFLANVSHDLRTPLTMIRGYAEMIRDVSWEDEETREADLNVIIRESDRLTALVNDILEYTALQSGGQKMAMKPFDLSATAQTVAERFAPLCEREGLTLETDIQPGLTVCGDAGQLSRVFYNLLDNALRHAGEKKLARLSLAGDGGAVRAEVRDFGPGIPAEKLPHVWERYFTSRRRGGRGSGLGLAITKEILTAHGAKFGAESQEGQGSLFWFELPAERIDSIYEAKYTSN